MPPRADELYVEHLEGARAGERDVVRPPGGWVGRDPRDRVVAIAEADASVSRRHARLVHRDGTWFVEGEGDANGTTFDGLPVQGRVPLKTGAILRLGRTVALRVTLPVAPASRTSTAAPTVPLILILGTLAIPGLVIALGLGSLGWRAYVEHREAAQRAERHAMWEASRAALDARMDAIDGNAWEDPEVARMVAELRRPEWYVEPSDDPLDTHLRVLMTQITGQPKNQPIHSGFLAEVEKHLVKAFVDPRGLCRYRSVQYAVIEELRDEYRRLGRPPEQADPLAIIPWGESAYNTLSEGSCGEAGMWQFMPRTAVAFDLPVNPRDMRCDWRASTRAAARLVAHNLDACGPDMPFLAIAAYNTGLGNSCLSRTIRALPPGERDLLGFYTHGVLRYEVTRNYVPQYAAFSFVAADYPAAAAYVRDQLGKSVPPVECDPTPWTLHEGPCPREGEVDMNGKRCL